MILRRAIRNATEIQAECPHRGLCSYLQAGQAQVWLSCGHYQGLKQNGNQLKVRCTFQQQESN